MTNRAIVAINDSEAIENFSAIAKWPILGDVD
jgi:hypothetical protein